MKMQDLTKLTERMQKALAENEPVKLSANFEDKVWEKIGESNPSPLARLVKTIFSPKPALAISGAIVTALAIIVVLNVNKKDTIQQVAQAPEKQVIKEVVKVPVKTETAKATPIAPKQEQNKARPAEVAVNLAVKAVETITAPAFEVPDQKPIFVPHASVPVAAVNKYSAAAVTATTAGNKPPEPAPALKPLMVANNVIHPALNESVTIRYAVGAASNVTIVIYDRKGRLIKKFHKGQKEAGNYTETWNGTDEYGNVVADGMYILHVKTDLTEENVKLGVIK